MRLTFASALLIATSAFSYAETFVVEPDVDRVDMYPDGAVIGRTASLSLSAGEHEVIVQGLPALKEPAELWTPQTLGLRMPGATIKSYAIHAQVANDEIRQEIEGLGREGDALTVQIQELLDSGETARAERDLVNRFLQDPALFAERPDVEEFWQTLITRHGTLSDELTQNQVQIDELKQARRAVWDQIGRLQEQEFEGQIHVSLSVPVGGDFDLETSYFSRFAGWTPSYTLDLLTSQTAAQGRVQFAQKADMWQQTGEDWDAVAAVLHSTSAMAYLTPPAGHPIILTPYENGDGAYLLSAEISPVNVSRLDEVSDLEQSAPATEFRGTYSTTYALAHPLTLATDLQNLSDHTQTIEIATADAELWVQAVAARDTRGLLMAGAQSPLSAVTLPGAARIFRDGALIGTTFLDAMQPGQSLELAFGFDSLSTINRHLIHDEEGDTGFTGRRAYLDRSIETLVSSSHAFTMPFRLIEAQPVSRHEDIEVEVLRGTDAFDAVDLDGAEGVNAWWVEVAPEATAKRSLIYRITWPESMDIGEL